MLKNTKEKAYAKVNFGLNVLPRRADGFHCIESIFQTIDLYDDLDISLSDKKECIVVCEQMELPEDNTLTKAYKAFCEISGIEVPGVKVLLRKGIPSGGGLGGGSSDAAAFIRGLERLLNTKLDDSKKTYIAEKTGSDVFFFMHCDENGGGCALVSGRGEIVKPIKARKDLWLIVIFPGVHSSTKEAYELVDEAMSKGNITKSPEFSDYEFIYNESIQKWSFINTFTPVIADKYEPIRNAIGDLKKTGCCYAEMSGSGATVFGMFTSKQQAEKTRTLLAASWNCKLVCTI